MRLPVITPSFKKIPQPRPVALFGRKVVACLSVLILITSLIGAWLIKNRAQDQLDKERQILDRQSYVPFEKKARSSPARNEIQLWQSTKNVRAIVRFRDSYFAATDGGLVEFSSAGNLLRHYSVLDGLAESDLTSLATFNSKLYLGTQTQGLVAFDGEHFESYRWPDRQPQAIAALLEDGGRLLIGTFAGGLMGFDGERFKEIEAGTDRQRLRAINCLAKDGSRLYVGTFSDGLWVEEAGRWLHFTTADGLLSDRITGVIASGENIFVASDFGLTVAPAATLIFEATQTQQKYFRALAILPSLSSIVKYRGGVLFCKDNGEIFSLSGDPKPLGHAQLKSVGGNRPSGLSDCRLAVLDGEPWLLSNEGIWRAHEERPNPSGAASTQLLFSSFGRIDGDRMPSNNIISALAFDSDDRLWVGSFRNGIDIFTPQGRVAHVESDTVREINFLVPDSRAKAVLAATSQGVVRFDQALHATRLTTADGLLSNSVSHIALTEARALGANQSARTAMVLATSRGLSMGEPGKLHGLTRVQGLPSDSLYVALPRGRSIFAGTLGGLAEIEAGKVVRVFKDSNSNLTHNWITGICVAGSRLFVGTYGGGVFELTASGELHSFSSEIGRSVVNPNAMWGDGERLYVGTLDGAWVFDLRSQKWTHLKDELPSTVVLSITGDERHVYFGTTSGIARIETGYWSQLPKGIDDGI